MSDSVWYEGEADRALKIGDAVRESIAREDAAYVISANVPKDITSDLKEVPKPSWTMKDIVDSLKHPSADETHPFPSLAVSGSPLMSPIEDVSLDDEMRQFVITAMKDNKKVQVIMVLFVRMRETIVRLAHGQASTEEVKSLQRNLEALSYGLALAVVAI